MNATRRHRIDGDPMILRRGRLCREGLHAIADDRVAWLPAVPDDDLIVTGWTFYEIRDDSSSAMTFDLILAATLDDDGSFSEKLFPLGDVPPIDVTFTKGGARLAFGPPSAPSFQTVRLDSVGPRDRRRLDVVHDERTGLSLGVRVIA